MTGLIALQQFNSCLVRLLFHYFIQLKQKLHEMVGRNRGTELEGRRAREGQIGEIKGQIVGIEGQMGGELGEIGGIEGQIGGMGKREGWEES